MSTETPLQEWSAQIAAPLKKFNEETYLRLPNHAKNDLIAASEAEYRQIEGAIKRANNITVTEKARLAQFLNSTRSEHLKMMRDLFDTRGVRRAGGVDVDAKPIPRDPNRL